jgi:hypothetical protein
MDIPTPGPNTSPMTLSIFERVKVMRFRLVAVQNPRPTIQNHFELDIPRDQILLSQIRDGDDPAMSVDDAPCVHLEKDHKVQPLAIDQPGQKALRFVPPRLTQFWCIDEAKPNGGLDV